MSHCEVFRDKSGVYQNAVFSFLSLFSLLNIDHFVFGPNYSEALLLLINIGQLVNSNNRYFAFNQQNQRGCFGKVPSPLHKHACDFSNCNRLNHMV